MTVGGVARKLRVEYPDAIDYVMRLGDCRETIFKDKADRERLLTVMSEACVDRRAIADGQQDSLGPICPTGSGVTTHKKHDTID